MDSFDYFKDTTQGYNLRLFMAVVLTLALIFGLRDCFEGGIEKRAKQAEGTDWFMDCMDLGAEYFREFFNPLCTLPRCREHVASLFGSETRDTAPSTAAYWHNIARPISSREWADIFRSKWEPAGYLATKEVFSFTKAHTMATNFDTCVLYRHRKHTFPTSRPDYVRDIYASLHMWDTGVGALDTWKKLYPPSSLCDLGRQLAAHVACSYANLRLCAERNTLPLVYHHLLELNASQLEGYLQCRLPSWVDAAAVAQQVVETRAGLDTLRARETRYKEVVEAVDKKEQLCTQMIADLVRLDSSFDASLLL